MNKILIAPMLAIACLLVTACTTVAQSPPASAILLGAIAAEQAATLRCPGTALEQAALATARLTFDARYAAALSSPQLAHLEEARSRTDSACGLGAASAGAG